MKTYSAVKNRILELCEEQHMSLHKLSINSGVSSSTIKNIIYGKSQNPGIVTIKMLCDGLDINLVDFFNTKEFKELEQELK
ncbi:MAG: helix-turn-helix domain-containing protein [Clostridia bacterium]|nr:helix-turn-helix domain-containing protein [Clostridia bacterium]